MIAQRMINLNNARILELDQLAAHALYNPHRREPLLARISPLDRAVAREMQGITHYLGPDGAESHFSYVPDRVMIRRLRGGLNNIAGKGMLEYNRIYRDKRGHFFDLDYGYSLPTGEDDAILCVSHYTANRWAAEGRLKIVEDVEAIDMHYVDPAMRVYTSNIYDGNTVPDIPLTEIDIIAVSEATWGNIDRLEASASSFWRGEIRRKLCPVPEIPLESSRSILPFVKDILESAGCRTTCQGVLVKDEPTILFWEIQKACTLQDLEQCGAMSDFVAGIEAVRRVISADPQLWGKTGEGYFDPLGIINYMIKSGKEIIL